MATSLQPLAQSETKTLFLQRLSLDTENAEDRALYQLMKAETLRERDYMHKDRTNLHPHMRNDPAYRSPYSYSWLTETAVHRAISRIFENASPVTKHYYDLGHYTTVVEENWVIRWLLWHVFRYRDARRTRRQGRSSEGQTQLDGEASGAILTLPPQPTAIEAPIGSGHGVTTAQSTQPEQPASYDRGRPSLSHQRSEHEQASADDHCHGTRSVATVVAGSTLNTRRVFDPVRDL